MNDIWSFIIAYTAVMLVWASVCIALYYISRGVLYVTVSIMRAKRSKAQNRRVPSADATMGLQERPVVAAGGDLRLEEGAKIDSGSVYAIPKVPPSPNAVPRPSHSQAAAAFFHQKDAERIDAPNLRWYVIRGGVAYEVSEFDARRLVCHDPSERVMHITERDAMAFFPTSKMMLNE